nr:hypothetical protein [uncultured Prevotella sp.]
MATTRRPRSDGENGNVSLIGIYHPFLHIGNRLTKRCRQSLNKKPENTYISP